MQDVDPYSQLHLESRQPLQSELFLLLRLQSRRRAVEDAAKADDGPNRMAGGTSHTGTLREARKR